MTLLKQLRALFLVTSQWRRVHRPGGTGVRHRDLRDAASVIPPKRILLIRLEGLGDFLLSLPAFRHFRRCFPEASLEILVSPENLELARLTSLFDALHAFSFFQREADANMANDTELESALAELRLGAFDIVVDMRHYRSTRRVATAILGRLKAGFRAPRKDRAFDLLMPDFDKLPKGRRVHMSDRQLMLAVAVAEAFGRQPADEYGCNNLLPARAAREAHGDTGETLIFINPYSGRPIKNWPAASYATVIESLNKRPNAKVFVLGESPGMPRSARDKLITLPGVVDLGAHLPIESLVDRLAAADLYIGNDSGTTHLAAQLGVPTIAIMSGDVDVEVWRPLGTNVVILRGDVPCAPCKLNSIGRCPVGHLCMETILPDTVLAVVDELLTPAG